ncbi:MAG: hypothetical protein GF308_11270 [Candidatus Heimdallarchaeota archaeon]|nr:hypothetical protein [Candidatus Heimdallarchaeota archaeon]
MRKKKIMTINLFCVLFLIFGTTFIVTKTSAFLIDRPGFYSGKVTFSGKVTLKKAFSSDPTRLVAGARLDFREDGCIKKTVWTDANGEYSFSYTVSQPERFYSMSVYKLGYTWQDRLLRPTSSTYEVNYELDGKVALFMYDSAISDSSTWTNYGHQLSDDEGFTNIMVRSDPPDWEQCIDQLDSLETYDSLVFILIHCHGVFLGDEDSVALIYEGDDYSSSHTIYSSDFVTKIKCLESINIIVLVDTCHSGDFVYEYRNEGNSDRILIMSGTEEENYPVDQGDEGPELYLAARYYGEGEYNMWEDPTPIDPNTATEGAFTHYYFDYLAQTSSFTTAFSYAKTATHNYSMDHFYTDDFYLVQYPQCYNNLKYTW